MSSKQIITTTGLTGPGPTGSHAIVYEPTTGVMGPLSNTGAVAGDVLTYDGSKVSWAAGGGGSATLTTNQKFANYWARRTWTTRTSATDSAWSGVCWGQNGATGQFVAVASSGTGNERVMRSTNGLTWVSVTSSPVVVENDWKRVCFSPELGLFCAVGTSGTGNRVMTSPDGNNWTIRTSAANQDWYDIVWSPTAVTTDDFGGPYVGTFCVVGNGTFVMTSPTGINWKTRTPAASENWRGLAWSPTAVTTDDFGGPYVGTFCAVALSGTGNRVMTSPTGENWKIRSSAADNSWLSVCWSPELSLFCAVSAGGVGNNVMTSPNGITWTPRVSAADNIWRNVCWSPELSLFCAVSDTNLGTINNRIMTSPDGINWTARTASANNDLQNICWSPERTLFCAVGTSGTGTRVMTSP